MKTLWSDMPVSRTSGRPSKTSIKHNFKNICFGSTYVQAKQKRKQERLMTTSNYFRLYSWLTKGHHEYGGLVFLNSNIIFWYLLKRLNCNFLGSPKLCISSWWVKHKQSWYINLHLLKSVFWTRTGKWKYMNQKWAVKDPSQLKEELMVAGGFPGGQFIE